jgi:hypothetical protein
MNRQLTGVLTCVPSGDDSERDVHGAARVWVGVRHGLCPRTAAQGTGDGGDDDDDEEEEEEDDEMSVIMIVIMMMMMMTMMMMVVMMMMMMMMMVVVPLSGR